MSQPWALSLSVLSGPETLSSGGPPQVVVGRKARRDIAACTGVRAT